MRIPRVLKKNTEELPVTEEPLVDDCKLFTNDVLRVFPTWSPSLPRVKAKSKQIPIPALATIIRPQ